MKTTIAQKSLKVFLKVVVGTVVLKTNCFLLDLKPAYAQSDDSAPSSIDTSAGDSNTDMQATPTEPTQQKEDSPKENLPKEDSDNGKKNKKKANKIETKTTEDAKSNAQNRNDGQKPEDYDAKTPAAFIKKLQIGLGGSLGIGHGPSSNFSSDYLGYYLQGSYELTQFQMGRSPISVNFVSRYATHTGVNKAKSQDIVVQRFMAGTGLEYKNGEAPFRFGGALSLGFTRAVAADFSLHEAYQKSYHFNSAIEAYASYRVRSKIALLGAIEAAPLSDYTWYGLQLGTLFSF